MRRIVSLLAVIMLIATMLFACSKPMDKMTAVELLDLGEKYLLEMNYKEAILCFDRLIEVEPRNTRGYTGLAEAYIALGNEDNAAETLRLGMQQLPNNVEIKAMLDEAIKSTSTQELTSLSQAELLNLGENSLLERNYEQAILYLTELIEKDSQSVRAYASLAEAYVALGKINEAIQYYKCAMEIAPKNIQLYIEIAKLYRQLGKENEALLMLAQGRAMALDESIFLQVWLSDKAVNAESVDWRTAYSRFLESDIPKCLQGDDGYEPGYMYALEDLNFDGIPELLSIRFVGNAAADHHLFVYTLQRGMVQMLQSYIYYGSETCEDTLQAYKNVNTGDIVYINRPSYGTLSRNGHEVTELGSLFSNSLYMRRLFSEESDSFWTKESCPQGAVLVDKEFQRYRVYRIDEEAVMPEQYYKEYDGYWKQWETIDWSIDWVSGEADGLGLSNQNIQRGIEVLFALYRPRFTYYANAETQESAVQLREMKAAYTDFIKSKEAGVRRFEKYGDMTPSIAVLNICGDSLPELVTITIEEDWWHLSVWSYENGAICLLEDEALSVTWGGSGVGVAKMTDGRLLVFSESYDEGFGSSMLRIFELKNGRFAKTTELEYGEGYSEEGRIEGFWNNGAEISESAYKSEQENMLAAIELPLIANPRDENYEVLNHFIGSKAMTYDEAIAFLSR